MINNINFVSKFKKAKILSVTIFILSIIFIFFKGLNYGIDFKGGTLIELRIDTSINASSIRDTLNSMDLGDINVKKFGKEGDYLIKVEQKNIENGNLIPEIKKKLSDKNLDFIVLNSEKEEPLYLKRPSFVPAQMLPFLSIRILQPRPWIPSLLPKLLNVFPS